MNDSGKREVAILGGGCFWCLEAVYELIPGILSVENGYAGGRLESPSYEEVCSGDSGHAEVVRLGFDPGKMSFSEILKLFWRIHNPCSLDRQGADVGSQYRSVIFYTSEEQKREAEASIAEAQTQFSEPIVTELLPAPRFWLAEDYHQGYYRKHPQAAYCQMVIAPKLKKAGFRGPAEG